MIERKIVSAKSLRKGPANVFFTTDGKTEYVRGWSEPVPDVPGVTFCKLSNNLINKLEPWHGVYAADLDTETITGEDLLTTYAYNERPAARVCNYIGKYFLNGPLVDDRDDLYNQKIFTDNFDFHKDIAATYKFYQMLYSSEPFPEQERSDTNKKIFFDYINKLYFAWNKFKSDGWAPEKSIPVLHNNNDEYVILDQCTLSAIAGTTDVNVNIDIVLEQV